MAKLSHRPMILLVGLLIGSLLMVERAAASLGEVVASHGESIVVAAISEDGRSFAVAGSQGKVTVWDTTTWNERATLPCQSVAIDSLALSADGSHIAIGGADGRVRQYEIGRENSLTVSPSRRGHICAVDYAGGDRRLAAGGGLFASPGHAVVIESEETSLRGHRQCVYALRWSPDDSLIATGGGRLLRPGELLLFNAETGRRVRQLEGGNDAIDTLAFSHDGSRLAAAGREQDVRIYDVASGELLFRVDSRRRGIATVAFSRDDTRLAVLTLDGRFMLWSLPERKLLGEICVPSVVQRAAVFSSDGETLYLGNRTGEIRVLSVDSAIDWRFAQTDNLNRCCEPPCEAPNIILIIADDLGYGDLGAYGQQTIQTPVIDHLARTGLRLTDYYAGAPLGNPSRCTLLTGLHTGHARIRDNEGNLPLAASDITVAELLQAGGYTTGAFGKWALGDEGTTGEPKKQGFDEFYGSLTRQHAENYYPEFLWRNHDREPVPGNAEGGEQVYAPDLFTDEAMSFISDHRREPFFLYLAYPTVHANTALPQGLQVPSDAPYGDADWPEPLRNYAAMITRMDHNIGRIVSLLEELGIDDDTIVFVTSDNGPHADGGADPQFFNSSGGLRGIKGSFYEGGLRVPMIVNWPGHIAPGRVSGRQAAHWDFLPTAADLAHAPLVPRHVDGVSMASLFRGDPPDTYEQRTMYFETHDDGFRQAIRFGPWKALRRGWGGEIEIYNLHSDIGETEDLASDRPDLVEQADELFRQSRTPSPHYPVAGE